MTEAYPEGSLVLLNPESVYATDTNGQLPVGVFGVVKRVRLEHLNEPYRHPYHIQWDYRGNIYHNSYRHKDLLPITPTSPESYGELL